MTAKLKPCPFCGSTIVEMDDNAAPFFVVCLHCQASGPMYDSWNAAATAWNRRAAKPPKTALGARGGSDPHPCRPKPSGAFCKGLAANCKAHPAQDAPSTPQGETR